MAFLLCVFSRKINLKELSSIPSLKESLLSGFYVSTAALKKRRQFLWLHLTSSWLLSVNIYLIFVNCY